MNRNTSLSTIAMSIIALMCLVGQAYALDIPEEPTSLKQLQKTQTAINKGDQGNNSTTAIPAVPEKRSVRTTQSIPTTPSVNVPNIAPIPKAPDVTAARQTQEAIETVKTLTSIQQIKRTLQSIEEARRVKRLGGKTIQLTNSEKHKTLTFALTAILEGDVNSAEDILEEHIDEIKDTVAQELAILNDNELTWEREGRHILNAAMHAANQKAKRPFLRILVYNTFDLE